MPAFNDWFPTSKYGHGRLNVKDFGAYGDGGTHVLGSGLGFATLADAQNGVGGNNIAYPSATALTDTADWCAIVEMFKQAFQHETSPGVWVPNGSEGLTRNIPVFFPKGNYSTNKPIFLVSVQGADILGEGGTITNSSSTTPNNVCVAANGFSFCTVKGVGFVTGGGADSIAFDLNCDGGTGVGGVATVNTNGDTFDGCYFSSPGGVGCNIADPSSPVLSPSGYMGSEIRFFNCTVANCTTGIAISNWNALNYTFIALGGTNCTLNVIRVNAGGMISLLNGSFAENGTDSGGADIHIGSGTASIIATRTESGNFVRASAPTTLLDCTQDQSGNYLTFVEVASGAKVSLINCQTQQGRIHGEGDITIDGCLFNNAPNLVVTAVSAGASGMARITHSDHAGYAGFGVEAFLDGDEVSVWNVVGPTTIDGIWNIAKVDHNNVDLIGSTYVASAYTVTGAGINCGPRFHLRGPDGSVSKLRPTPVQERGVHTTKVRSMQLLLTDGGATFDNRGATGAIVFTLPNLISSSSAVRGTIYRFMVLTAQALTVQTYDFGDPGAFGLSSRIFRSGGYATAGTQITCSTIGASLEIYLADGAPPGSEAEYVAGNLQLPHRWLVRAETGTWTISGTPPYD